MIRLRRVGNAVGISPASPVESFICRPLIWHKRRRNPDPITRSRQYYIDEPIALYRIDRQYDEIITYAGFIPRLTELLHDRGFETSFEDQQPLPSLPVDRSRIGDFRPLQSEAFDVILNNPYGFGVIDCVTAFGKTEIIAKLCAAYSTARIIVVAPSLEICKTNRARMRDYGIRAGRVDGAKNKPARVTTVCAPSLRKLRDPDSVDIVLFDEVHRAPAHRTIEGLMRIKKSRMFGLTASLEGRSDQGETVIEALFGQPICQIPYDDAVSNRLVVPMVVLMLNTTGPIWAADDPTDKTRHLIWRNQYRNKMFADVASAVSRFGQVMLMPAVLEHGINLRKRLQDWPLIYASKPSEMEYDENLGPNSAWNKQAAHSQLIRSGLAEVGAGEVDEEYVRHVAERFKSGELPGVIATHMWSTGVDFPKLNVVGRVDGQSSDIGSIQISGRASRTSDGKHCGIVLDGEDDFDRSLQNRKRRRLTAYNRQKWIVRRNLSASAAISLCQGLIQQGLTSLSGCSSALQTSCS